MYLIKLNDITDTRIINEIKLQMNKYSLYDICYLNYVTTSQIVSDVEVDFLTIKAKEFISNNKFSKEQLEKLLNKVNVIIDIDNCSNEEISYLNLMFGKINFKLLKERKKFDIYNLTFNDICIIKDLLQVKNNKKTFSKRDFQMIVDIDNIGDVVINKKFIGNIFDTPFITLITSVSVEDRKEEYEDSIFGCYIYEPWSFLDETYNNEEIIKYKIEVFDKIKNLSDEEYFRLPLELKELLAKNYYIRWDDFIKIITKKDEVLNEFY